MLHHVKVGVVSLLLARHNYTQFKSIIVNDMAGSKPII